MLQTMFLCLSLVVLACSAAAGFDPEQILGQLRPRLNGWRYQFGGEPGGEAVDLDDSSWPVVNVGHAWRGDNTSVWYRRVITIPEKIGGFAISASAVRLRMAIDDDGEIYADGRHLQSFHRDEGNAIIAESAPPGHSILVAVKGKNQSGPGRLLDARLSIEGFDDIASSLEAYIFDRDAARALATGEGEAAVNARRVIADAEALLDAGALERGDKQALLASVQAALKRLSALSPMVKSHRITLLANAHIDLAWLWPWSETVQVCRDTFSSVLGLMKDYPDLVYAQSQAAAYLWMQERYPEIFEGIRKAVSEGRWEIVGGMWAESDGNIPSGESFVRQLLYGKRYFLKNFGLDVKVGWLPDTFGFNWNLPQIFRKAGLDYFLTTKLNSNEVTRLPHAVFWWEAPDGSRVLAYHPVIGYGGGIEAPRLLNSLSRFEELDGLKDMLYLYGVGDHGGGPSREMLDSAKGLGNSDMFPSLAHGTALDWFRKAQASGDLTTWKSELYFEHHRGTYTSQANQKRGNRESENLLQQAELFSTWANLMGRPYPAEELAEAWRLTLFNQFHDILPGSSIHQVYVDSAKDYARIRQLAEGALESALKRIAGSVDTAAMQGQPVVVFNPLCWKRDDLVEIEAPFKSQCFSIQDESGRTMPWQMTAEGKLLFLPRDVPSMGYRVFWISPSRRAPRFASKLRANSPTLENEWFRLRLDENSGFCSSIVDKRGNRELLIRRGQGFQLQAFQDEGDAWDILADYKQHPIELSPGAEIEVLEQGPLRACVSVKRRLGNSSIEQRLMLYRHVPRIDCLMNADWRETHVLLKAAFPLRIKSDSASYEIAYATIERSTLEDTPARKAQFEVSAQKWADVSGRDSGVSLLNNCKYGYDIKAMPEAKGTMMRISLLRSPTSPDPQADKHDHTFTISLYPHAGDWRKANTVHRAWELNMPLAARVEPRHRGRLKPSGSFLAVSPKNVIVTVVKKAEDSQEVILRWYEAEGKDSIARIRLSAPVKEARETDLLEKPLAKVQISGGALVVPTGHYEIKTVKVSVVRSQGARTRR